MSKVRSIVLDDLDTELLDMMVALGNARANAIWEATVPAPPGGGAAASAASMAAPTRGLHGTPTAAIGAHAAAAAAAAAGGALDGCPHKPSPATPREEKEEFIQTKYVKRSFLPPAILACAGSAVSEERYGEFMQACERDDLEGMLVHLLQGCLVDWRNPSDRSRTALHHAAKCDAVLACEYLIQNNATVTVEDADGKTPLDIARESDSKRVIARLQGASGKKQSQAAATH